MAKDIIGKYWDTTCKEQRVFSDSGNALNDEKSKLADIQAKEIGFKYCGSCWKYLANLCPSRLISVWRSLQILEFDRLSWKRRSFRGVDDIEEILDNFLNHQYPGQFLTRLTYYSSQNWTTLDTKNLRSFVHSRSGRALHLAHFYLLKRNLIFGAIQEDYQRVITRMRRPEIKFSMSLRSTMTMHHGQIGFVVSEV